MDKYDIVMESKNIYYVKLSEYLLDDYLLRINDIDVQKLISTEKNNYTKEQELEWIRNNKDNTNNNFIFSMIEKNTNKFIGNIELKDINNNSSEIGICITKDMQNKKYGSECLHKIIDYAFNTINLEELTLVVFSSNLRAHHLYSKLGFNEYKIESTHDIDGNPVADIYMKKCKPIINIQTIINDLQCKLNISVNEDKITHYTDGATESIVFSIDNKYLIKTMDNHTLEVQEEFFNNYSNDCFQKVLYVNKELKYICFEYIDGVKEKDYSIYNTEYIIKQIYDICNIYKPYEYEGYGYLYEDNKTWYQFLYDEVMYSSKEIPDIDMHRVNDSLNKIKEFNVDKYLIHGDFGVHNFIINNGKIKVIDPMGVIGDQLYDFYFATLSTSALFTNIDLILSYFDKDINYKKALFYIVLYIRMSRAYKYDRNHFDKYLELYERCE